MQKVFMVHGFMGEPNGGWRPWLMGELAQKGIYACSLPMPQADSPIKIEWLKEISNAVGDPNQEVFLVGHSLGVPAILQYLQTLSTGRTIGGALLVSGPYKKLETENPTAVIRKIDNFFEPSFDFPKIKSACKNFSIIHGDDDPKVSFEHARFLSENLNAPVTTVVGGRHLGGHEGWYELPQALQALELMMK